MLDLEPRAAVADVMERALYNNVLAGMELSGKRFFYVNPLSMEPAVAKRRHDCRLVKTSRVPWFGCACCPPNIARTLASLGHYMASRLPAGVWLHLYAASEMRWSQDGTAVRLVMETDYPWSGEIKIRLGPEAPVAFALALRLPGWCGNPQLRVNGERVGLAPVTRGGYAVLERTWKSGDEIELTLPMPVERLRANPAVSALAGQVALQRGPIVYAIEEADHGKNLAGISLPRETPLRARHDPDLLGGVVVIEGAARRAQTTPGLYQPAPLATEPVAFRAVPYAWWNNRGEGEMRVWLNEI